MKQLTTLERWSRLLVFLQLPDNVATHERLVAAYSEPQRHYHTTEHVSACLRHLDKYRELFQRPEEAELALWFHDAIYDPHSASNEADSAIWAQQFLRSADADSAMVDRVFQLIMATEHSAAVALEDADAQVLVDIDLAILASKPAVYEEFERNVRREYEFVPLPLFREKRGEILQSFLSRPFVYGNALLRENWEASARRNLAAAIQRLAA